MRSQGFEAIRFGDHPWEPRSEDRWPCLVKRQIVDERRGMAVRTVWYPRDSTEARHVHEGTHAALILLGSAEVGGTELGPWDAIYGPGGEPHGPHHYPMGCLLFALISGGTFHTAVDASARPAEGREGETSAHLVIAGDRPWLPPADDPGAWKCERKPLVRDQGRRHAAALLRWRERSSETTKPFDGVLAAVVLAGRLELDGTELGPWDAFYAPGDRPHPALRPTGGCVVAVSIGGSPPSELMLDG